MNDITPYKSLWESLEYSSTLGNKDIIDEADTLITSGCTDFGPTFGIVVNYKNSEFIWGGGKIEGVLNIKERTFMNSVDFNSYFNFYPEQDFNFNLKCYTEFWNLFAKSSNFTDIELYWEIRLNIDSELKWSRLRITLSTLNEGVGIPFPISLITDIRETKLDNYLVFYAFDKRKKEILIKKKEWAYPLGTSILTGREREIVYMVAEGLPTKQIADKLFIAENTVKVHKQRIFKKLDVNNSIEMMRLVCKKKLIEWP